MTVGQCTVPSWEQIRCLRTRLIWIGGQTPASLKGPSPNSCGGCSRRRRALPTSTFVLMKEPLLRGGMERLRPTGRHSCPRGSYALNSARTSNRKPKPTTITKNDSKKSPESRTRYSSLRLQETGLMQRVGQRDDDKMECLPQSRRTMRIG